MQSHKKSSISLIGLSMLMTGTIDGVSNLPSIALFGSHIIFFFLLATAVFLVPTGLISAELCAQFKDKSGIYEWSKAAFGENASLLAVWLQWINTMIYFPMCLTTMVGTMAYILNPTLLHQPLFLVMGSLLLFWSMTYINLKGIKSSIKIAGFATIAGMMIPMGLVLSLCAIGLILGKPHAIHLSIANSMPQLTHLNTWSALTAIITAFLGMELATVHVKKIKNADKLFPKAIIITIILVILTMGLGSLGVALMIPANKIQLVAGAMQILTTLLTHFHMMWLSKIIGVMLLLGSIGALINLLISPANGLAQVAKDHFLPKALAAENQYGASKNILLLQALIVSIVLLVFFIMPSINGSYWLLLDLSTELYLFMYILLFSVAIKLLWKIPKIKIIPAAKIGAMTVAILGLIGSIIAIIVGFIPPPNINIGSVMHYEYIFCGGLLLMLSPVGLLYAYKKWYQRAFIPSESIHSIS